MSELALNTVAEIKSRPIGRILRFLLGADLLVLAVPAIARVSLTTDLIIGGVILGLVAGYTAIHFSVRRFVPKLNRWLGAGLAVAPAGLLFVFGDVIGQISVAGYIGASLLIDSVNGDAGCEVMAVPGILLNERTHLACLLFSPLDWLENKLFS